LISRIRSVERINISAEKVTEVEVAMLRGERLIFQPKALVFAAGAGNRGLLERASIEHKAFAGRITGAQQIRKSFMLVVKGEKASLEPLTGVFPRLGGLFIASRDLGSETVWLISDNRSSPLSAVEDWMEFDARLWLQPVLASLRKLAPKYFLNPEFYEWGIYDAPKAEGKAASAIPHEERIEKFGLDNLWTIWPTKLTLAPLASSIVKEEIRGWVGSPTPWTYEPEPWSESRTPAEVALECWRKTPLVSWDQFRRCYSLP
jgi:hypothetical protein